MAAAPSRHLGPSDRSQWRRLLHLLLGAGGQEAFGRFEAHGEGIDSAVDRDAVLVVVVQTMQQPIDRHVNHLAIFVSIRSVLLLQFVLTNGIVAVQIDRDEFCPAAADVIGLAQDALAIGRRCLLVGGRRVLVSILVCFRCGLLVEGRGWELETVALEVGGVLFDEHQTIVHRVPSQDGDGGHA